MKKYYEIVIHTCTLIQSFYSNANNDLDDKKNKFSLIDKTLIASYNKLLTHYEKNEKNYEEKIKYYIHSKKVSTWYYYKAANPNNEEMS